MAIVKTNDGTIVYLDGESKFFRHPEVTELDRLKNLIEMRHQISQENLNLASAWGM